jgi:peptidoglycan/LPS O-acetylase OafA/YrhL
MNRNSKTHYLDILQIFRGIAALMVIVHHAVGSLSFYHQIDYLLLSYIGLLGKFGVDFFFILSGFIISYAAYYKYSEPDSFKKYIKNRIIRIYIPYLPIGILMYILYTYYPSFSNSNREISLFTSVTLLPFGNPALSVAWSLTFELLFYFIFSISFFSRKAWNYFLLLWTVIILLFNFSSLHNLSINNNVTFRILLSTYNIEFILGYVLSLLIIYKIRLSLNKIIIWLVMLFLVFFGINNFCTNTPYFFPNFLFSGVSFFILYYMITNYNYQLNKNSIMMIIGNASYSIYLIHNPLQLVILRMYPKINTVASLILSLALVLIASCLFGYVYYLIFEKKCMNFIKSKILG